MLRTSLEMLTLWQKGIRRDSENPKGHVQILLQPKTLEPSIQVLNSVDMELNAAASLVSNGLNQNFPSNVTQAWGRSSLT